MLNSSLSIHLKNYSVVNCCNDYKSQNNFYHRRVDKILLRAIIRYSIRNLGTPQHASRASPVSACNLTYLYRIIHTKLSRSLPRTLLLPGPFIDGSNLPALTYLGSGRPQIICEVFMTSTSTDSILQKNVKVYCNI